MRDHLQAGRLGEAIACEFLQSRGLELLFSNYRCRFGELDLIMLDQGCLVIIEVRYRRSVEIGPLATIDRGKRRRLGRAARAFLQRYRGLSQLPLRFDVVGLSGPSEKPRIKWIKSAFQFDLVC